VNGAFVTVQISDPHPVNSLIIPRAAVLSDQEGDYVFVLDGQNQARRADVKLGETFDANQVVDSGLKEGQRVVVDGVQRVHAGIVVTPATPEPVAGSTPTQGGPSASAGKAAAQNGTGAPSQAPGTTPSRQ
jgi:membrane fusion protein (multidrug efflux system)